MNSSAFELFHSIADPGSARVRRAIVEWGLEPHVRFRNISYPEVQTDLLARGGVSAPALWDGQKLHTGADAVIARLNAFRDVGRAE